MALTLLASQAKAGFAPGDPMYIDVITLSLDNSYPTGGYAFDALFASSIAKGRTILGVTQNNEPGSVKIHPRYVRSTGKLMAIVQSTGAEVAAAVDLSSVVGLELVVLSK